MTQHQNYESLNPFDWNHYQELIDQFEDAWEEGEPESFDPFLPPAEDANRKPVLRELVKSDLEIRWRKGKGKRIEGYLGLYPELGTIATLPVEIIYEEYRVRQLFGDKPELEEYQIRFPDQYFELARQVQSNPVAAQQAIDTDHPETEREPQVEKTVPPAEAAQRDAERQGDRDSHTPRGASTRKTGSSRGGGSQFASNVYHEGERYPVGKRLGAGTFGEVYESEALGGIPVAIKRLFKPIEEEEAQRELESLELIKKVSHPFLLATHEFWIDDGGFLYTVTDLAEGTLRDRMKECKPEGIPPAELIEYIDQAAQAIDHLHTKQILHRDIKPANILLKEGFVKVADFGLARSGDLNTIISDATLAGTLAYMPPEVYKNQVSKQSDQYSLALTYAELRMAKRPFSVGSLHEMMMQSSTRLPKLEGLPEAEQMVLGRALATEPKARYPSCVEWVRDLRRALIESEVIEGEIHDGPDEGFLKKLALGVGIGVVAVGLLLGAAIHFGWISTGSSSTPSAPFTARAKSHEQPAGTMRTLTLAVGRATSTEPIRFTFEELPRFLRVDPPEPVIEPKQEETTVRLIVAPDAPEGETKLTLSASDGEHTEKRSLTLTIQKRSYPLPSGASPRLGAKWVEVPEEGQVYYDRISLTKAGQDIIFHLVPRGVHDKKAPKPIPSFYMMRDKAWLSLFRSFAREMAEAKTPLVDSFWRLPYDHDHDKDGESDRDYMFNWNDDHPVMGVVPADADRFARWVGGLLPIPEQWDKAVGRYGSDWQPQARVMTGHNFYRVRDTVSALMVGSAGYQCVLPLLAHSGTTTSHRGKRSTASPFGVEDLEGNFQEWTGRAALADSEDRDVSATWGFDKLTVADSVYLRGDDSTALYFPYWEDVVCALRNRVSGALPTIERVQDVGFRVVLPLQPSAEEER